MSQKDFFRRIKLYIKVTNVRDIARRYFVKNGMDGSMTVLGIILGAWTAKVDASQIVLMAGLGACLAMGVSGIFGAYITEKAEQKRHLKDLESSMLIDLDGSVHQDASNVVPAFAALVDGLSPALTAVISLIPFVLSMANVMSIWDSYAISFILTFITLFALGLYLGNIAKERMWFYALMMLASGGVITILVIILGNIQAL